jgi:glycosyltransferase involved in cell wall biosynthesis
MAGPFQASVIICAHNPRPDYFRRVLTALRDQTLSATNWELVLVDNACDMPLALTWDISWHPNARHIREDELGISVARRRGMQEASADLLIFVDDDNVLERNYLLHAVSIRKDWPILGVWGSGATIPEFERQPSEYFAPIVPYLALRECSSPQWSNVFPCVSATPWGAGMCLTRNVAGAYRDYNDESSIQMTSRKGKKSLMCGEDLEICYVACKLGAGMGIFPQLKLTHLIPKERVSKEYLLKLYEGARASIMLLVYKRTRIAPQFPLWPLGLLDTLKHLVTERGIHRHMYLANVRAAFAARRVIKMSELAATRGPSGRIELP